jgi:hypothetical protein
MRLCLDRQARKPTGELRNLREQVLYVVTQHQLIILLGSLEDVHQAAERRSTHEPARRLGEQGRRFGAVNVGRSAGGSGCQRQADHERGGDECGSEHAGGVELSTDLS